MPLCHTSVYNYCMFSAKKMLGFFVLMMQKKKVKVSDQIFIWLHVADCIKCVIVNQKRKQNQTNRASENEEQRLQISLQKLHQTMNHFKTNTKQKHVALLSYNI